ncbi:hypothetical protein ABZV78_14255 [Micromonospora sp. NPDC004540]|uniref:hypothetical protein n=1 Tax=Micromonospora sp. NPDC004540 TaxID=3154457 RepID=UPI0033AE945F
MTTTPATPGAAETVSGDAPSPTAQRRATAVVPALLGLILLVGAHTRPWVTVSPGLDPVDRMFGIGTGPAPTRTYALTELPAAQVALYVGWLLLVALFVTAWTRPAWRDGLRPVTGLVFLIVAALTFVASMVALRTAGYGDGPQPDSTYRAGTWLALLAAFLLVRGVAVLLTPEGGRNRRSRR